MDLSHSDGMGGFSLMVLGRENHNYFCSICEEFLLILFQTVGDDDIRPI